MESPQAWHHGHPRPPGRSQDSGGWTGHRDSSTGAVLSHGQPKRPSPPATCSPSEGHGTRSPPRGLRQPPSHPEHLCLLRVGQAGPGGSLLAEGSQELSCFFSREITARLPFIGGSPDCYPTDLPVHTGRRWLLASQERGLTRNSPTGNLTVGFQPPELRAWSGVWVAESAGLWYCSLGHNKDKVFGLCPRS